VPTVSLTLSKEITELSRPSLSCFVEHPFGRTLGDAGDRNTHRAVVLEALHQATLPHPAGAIVDLGFRWRKDDLRERQLRDRHVI